MKLISKMIETKEKRMNETLTHFLLRTYGFLQLVHRHIMDFQMPHTIQNYTRSRHASYSLIAFLTSLQVALTE